MPARSRLSVTPSAASTLLNGILAVPLRSISLSLSLSTLPLTLVLFMVGLGECPVILDSALALFGLQRTGRAQDTLKATEAALRQQLRQASARAKVAQEATERADQARVIAERALQDALDRCGLLVAGVTTAGPSGQTHSRHALTPQYVKIQSSSRRGSFWSRCEPPWRALGQWKLWACRSQG